MKLALLATALFLIIGVHAAVNLPAESTLTIGNDAIVIERAANGIGVQGTNSKFNTINFNEQVRVRGNVTFNTTSRTCGTTRTAGLLFGCGYGAHSQGLHSLDLYTSNSIAPKYKRFILIEDPFSDSVHGIGIVDSEYPSGMVFKLEENDLGTITPEYIGEDLNIDVDAQFNRVAVINNTIAWVLSGDEYTGGSIGLLSPDGRKQYLQNTPYGRVLIPVNETTVLISDQTIGDTAPTYLVDIVTGSVTNISTAYYTIAAQHSRIEEGILINNTALFIQGYDYVLDDGFIAVYDVPSNTFDSYYTYTDLGANDVGNAIARSTDTVDFLIETAGPTERRVLNVTSNTIANSTISYGTTANLLFSYNQTAMLSDDYIGDEFNYVHEVLLLDKSSGAILSNLTAAPGIRTRSIEQAPIQGKHGVYAGDAFYPLARISMSGVQHMLETAEDWIKSADNEIPLYATAEYAVYEQGIINLSGGANASIESPYGVMIDGNILYFSNGTLYNYSLFSSGTGNALFSNMTWSGLIDGDSYKVTDTTIIVVQSDINSTITQYGIIDLNTRTIRNISGELDQYDGQTASIQFMPLNSSAALGFVYNWLTDYRQTFTMDLATGSTINRTADVEGYSVDNSYFVTAVGGAVVVHNQHTIATLNATTWTETHQIGPIGNMFELQTDRNTYGDSVYGLDNNGFYSYKTLYQYNTSSNEYTKILDCDCDDIFVGEDGSVYFDLASTAKYNNVLSKSLRYVDGSVQAMLGLPYSQRIESQPVIDSVQRANGQVYGFGEGIYLFDAVSREWLNIVLPSVESTYRAIANLTDGTVILVSDAPIRIGEDNYFAFNTSDYSLTQFPVPNDQVYSDLKLFPVNATHIYYLGLYEGEPTQGNFGYFIPYETTWHSIRGTDPSNWTNGTYPTTISYYNNSAVYLSGFNDVPEKWGIYNYITNTSTDLSSGTVATATWIEQIIQKNETHAYYVGYDSNSNQDIFGIYNHQTSTATDLIPTASWWTTEQYPYHILTAPNGSLYIFNTNSVARYEPSTNTTVNVTYALPFDFDYDNVYIDEYGIHGMAGDYFSDYFFGDVVKSRAVLAQPSGFAINENITTRALTVGDGMIVQTAAGATALTVNTTTGNVGIGTLSPGEALSVAGNINASSSINSNAGVDLAEVFSAVQAMQGGTVVQITADGRVAPASEAALAFGVVSSSPGMTLGDPDATNPTAVALIGRVPVRIEGNVQAGDLLGLSGTAGVATKLTSPGFVIGRALEASTTNTVMALITPGYAGVLP